MIPKSIEQILMKMEKNGFEAYLVGGFVRDTLLQKKNNDFDIATNALPKDLVKLFGPNKKVAYGSYNLKMKNYNVDITSYRKEKYQNHKLVKIEYTSNLLEDMMRRDFTVNALYMNRKGYIIDPYHYQKDLEAKVLKTIGNPRIRFQEDPLRILRAIRFEIKYSFQMDSQLQKAIQTEKKHLLTLPKERIKKELDAILLMNGFAELKKFNLLKILGLEAKEVRYVEDLAGLWAQIKTKIEYPTEKNLKKRQKKIEDLLKCGTIKMFDLYEYGYYDCLVAAQILNIEKKDLETMWQQMPIHTRKEIAISPLEVAAIAHVTKKELGDLLKVLEQNILLKNVLNERESIEKFLKEVKKCQTSNF